jgi:hypothetical protein
VTVHAQRCRCCGNAQADTDRLHICARGDPQARVVVA